MSRPGQLSGLVAALLLAGPATACPPPPPAVRDLDVPRFYADPSGSKVDARQKAANEAAVAPLAQFLRHVTAEADKTLIRAKPAERAAAAACGLAWLEAWARGGAWLGRMGGQQSEYQRKWDLAGVALAYIKLKPRADARQRQAIEPWLERWAGAARGFFDDPTRKRNNHWYWLGLALGGTALAIGNEAMWAEARTVMTDAARDIGADGTLAMELERQGRALHYHAFAAMPLVILAELAAARGEDWYGIGGGALHRLVALTARGLEQPEIFAALARTPQELTSGSAGTGWLALYQRRFPGRIVALPAAARTSHRWTGGDAMLLAEAARQLPAR